MWQRRRLIYQEISQALFFIRFKWFFKQPQIYLEYYYDFSHHHHIDTDADAYSFPIQ